MNARILADAPGSTLSERLGFCRRFYLDRARNALDLARTYRTTGRTHRAVALQLTIAASWRADAAAAGIHQLTEA